MTGKSVRTTALMGALTLVFALPAGANQQKEGNQAAAAGLARQLAVETGTIRQAARATERPAP